MDKKSGRDGPDDKNWIFFHYFEKKNKIHFFSQQPIKAFEHLLQCDIMYFFRHFII